MTTKFEMTLNAPPVAIAGVSVLGFSLPEWAAIVTIIYTLVLMYFRIRQEIKKRKGRKAQRGVDE